MVISRASPRSLVNVALAGDVSRIVSVPDRRSHVPERSVAGGEPRHRTDLHLGSSLPCRSPGGPEPAKTGETR